MVKRLRRRPLTAESGVRFPMEVPRIKAVLRGGFFYPKKCPRAQSALRYFLGAPGELRMRECEFALVSGAERPAVLFGGPEFTPKSVLARRNLAPVLFGDPEFTPKSVLARRSLAPVLFGGPELLRISVCEFALVSGAERPAVLFGGPEFTPKSVLARRSLAPVLFGGPGRASNEEVRVRISLGRRAPCGTFWGAELLRMSVWEFEAFLDMTKTLSERSYTSHHIFSKTELRACTRTYLFEAFLHSRQLGTG